MVFEMSRRHEQWRCVRLGLAAQDWLVLFLSRLDRWGKGNLCVEWVSSVAKIGRGRVEVETVKQSLAVSRAHPQVDIPK